MRDLINQIKQSKDPNYCQRVTANDGALGEQHLRDFQDNEKSIPTILTTSQKLSTGVDARNIRKIVLMRTINSMIEFKQIIGRGTRLYDGKDYFTIYDFVKAHHHFSDPEWDGEPLEPDEAKPKEPGSGAREPSPPEYEPGPRPRKIKVKLADGKLLVGSQTFESPQRRMTGPTGYTGNFVVSEVTFDDQRWFELDPEKVIVKLEVNNPDLSRVDEIGYVDLMPGGGHGTAGCTNVSWIEVYATPRKR